MSRPINLVLDWDGTITRGDTMFMMGQIACQRDARLRQQSRATNAWKTFGDAYMTDFSEHQRQYNTVRTPAIDARHPDQLIEWLRSLRHVEQQSSDRVEKSRFFEAVKIEDIEAASRLALQAGNVSLRSGWDRLFLEFARESQAGKKIIPGNSSLSILSVNWSETFIRTCLTKATDVQDGLDETERETLRSLIKTMPIIANDLEGLQDLNGSSGQLSRTVQTSEDKLKHFQRPQNHLNVYVGDSETDLECLLSADVGICIVDGKETTLVSALKRMGWQAPHWRDLAKESIGQDATLSNIWWARDFDEISEVLFRVIG